MTTSRILYPTFLLAALLLAVGVVWPHKATSSADEHTIFLPLILLPEPRATSVTMVEYIDPIINQNGITIITHAGDDRLFVGTQSGRVYIVDPDPSGLSGERRTAPFLDLAANVEVSFEEGLLGLAFHPDFANNRTFFVTYTERRDPANPAFGGDLILSRFTTRAAFPDEADLNSEQILLRIDKPFIDGQGDSAVHNGGDIHFGPDGYLYVALGDGGPDPYQVADRPADIFDHGQRLDVLWGKILRLDIDAATGTAPDCGVSDAPYTVPPGNVFADGPEGQCDEIWSYGWRNPWRFSFDRVTGDMYIGDVGEGNWEEINYEPAGVAGRNYGWACYEGDKLNSQLCTGAYEFPVHQYNHDNGGCSVIGGYVYRGAAYPTLNGLYLFTDFCQRTIWSLDVTNLAAAPVEMAPGNPYPQWTTIGEDASGELYFGGYITGRLFKVTVP